MNLDEGDAAFPLKCAECHSDLGNFGMAHKYYLQAIEIDNGKQGKYCYCYGFFLCHAVGDLQTAKIYYLKAIEIDATYFRPYYVYAEMLRDFVEDYRESEKNFMGALQINHRDGRIHGSYGDYMSARKYVEKTMKMNDNNLWSHLYFCNEMMNMQRTDESDLYCDS